MRKRIIFNNLSGFNRSLLNKDVFWKFVFYGKPGSPVQWQRALFTSVDGIHTSLGFIQTGNTAPTAYGILYSLGAVSDETKNSAPLKTASGMLLSIHKPLLYNQVSLCWSLIQDNSGHSFNARSDQDPNQFRSESDVTGPGQGHLIPREVENMNI